MLSFQRLRVYQLAIEFLALVIEIVEQLPRGHADRADQLIRAAESVVGNIAERAGRWSRRDGSKHYKIARGEAMECAASLDVLKLRKLVDAQRYDRGVDLLQGVRLDADQDALIPNVYVGRPSSGPCRCQRPRLCPSLR